jgi:hypothetical protein
MSDSGRQDSNTSERLPSTPMREGDPANASRRRFGKAGLAVSGIIATLASRPVLGAEMCKSPSGFLSGNLSTHGDPPVCAGRSPGYWKTHEYWPIANRTTAKFSKVFSCNVGSPYASATLLELLTHQDYDTHNLGMHLVAAYLNARQGWTSFLAETTIRSMFSEWQATGYFEPTAGVKWDAAQIVDYLEQTQFMD